MALLINKAQILYYQMDAIRSTLLRHSYFRSPDDLTVKAWISGYISLSRSYIANQTIYLWIGRNPFGEVGHFSDGFHCHHIVAVFNLLNHLLVAAFPTVWSTNVSLCHCIIIILASIQQWGIKHPRNKCMSSFFFVVIFDLINLMYVLQQCICLGV